jgi:hypothetical protein
MAASRDPDQVSVFAFFLLKEKAENTKSPQTKPPNLWSSGQRKAEAKDFSMGRSWKNVVG